MARIPPLKIVNFLDKMCFKSFKIWSKFKGKMCFKSLYFKNGGFGPCIFVNVEDFVPIQVKMKYRVTDKIHHISEI